MDNPRIKSPRQQRAIKALLEKVVAVSDMGPLIGAHNPRQIIFELRNQGFEGIIKTRRFTVKDQDGRRCRPGEYYIPEELKPIAEKALTEFHARRSIIAKQQDNNDSTRRE